MMKDDVCEELYLQKEWDNAYNFNSIKRIALYTDESNKFDIIKSANRRANMEYKANMEDTTNMKDTTNTTTEMSPSNKRGWFIPPPKTPPPLNLTPQQQWSHEKALINAGPFWEST